MQRVFRVGTHARNIEVACVRGAAGIQTGASRQSFALALEADSKLAAVGTCRKAEERYQWVGRGRHDRSLPGYARANPKGEFRFAGLLGLRVEDRHFDARRMVVQLWHP